MPRTNQVRDGSGEIQGEDVWQNKTAKNPSCLKVLADALV